MPIEKDELFNILQNNFPEAQINITSLVDDNDHYSLEITSHIFNGKTKLEQHKMVKTALKEILIDRLHALQIKTKAI